MYFIKISKWEEIVMERKEEQQMTSLEKIASVLWKLAMEVPIVLAIIIVGGAFWLVAMIDIGTDFFQSIG